MPVASVTLKSVTLPEFGEPTVAPKIPPATYEARIGALLERGKAAGLDGFAVFGDREHAANVAYLCGYDPRFEEALLLLGPGERLVLIVGNEDLGYVPVARLPVEPVLYQPFSLMAQPRGETPRLADLLRDLGIGAGARVGVVGWKYFAAGEEDEQTLPPFVPAFVSETLRRVTGEAPNDVTATLMHPTDGLRVRNSAAQIAA